MGANYDPSQLEALVPGLSEREVVSRLGQPNARSFTSTGEQVLVWSFSKGNALGGAKARMATLLFDREHRFVRVLSVAESKSR
jgi:hypothetical protein